MVVLVFLPSYSYSESIVPYYGTTGNAITDQSLRWSMTNVLPSPPGLDINTVIYNYTIRKATEDQVDVYVGNENITGTGYVFREHDQWRPGSLDGTQINKVVGVGSIPRDLWGDGFIDVEGNGSIEDPTLVYTYRVDPCYNQQFSPNCPGYVTPKVDIPVIDLTTLYDVTQDPNVTLAREACYDSNPDRECDSLFGEDEEEKTEEELAEEEAKESERRAIRLEEALSTADNSALFATALAQSNILLSMDRATNINIYYNASIQGGVYNDKIILIDKQLPDSKRGLRNGLAQQVLHNKMIEMQYTK